MIKFKLVVVFIALLFLMATIPAFASLKVTGWLFEKEVAPGDSLSYIIPISTDSSDGPTDVQGDIIEYSQTLDGFNTGADISHDASPYSAKPFLTVSPERIHLEPGDSKEITVGGIVPTDVGSGGRYAVINVHTVSGNNGSLSFGAGFDIPIRLTINGSELLHTGEIQNLSLAKPVTAKEQNISFIFKNTGNHHYKIQSDAIVMDKDGNVAANATEPNPGASIIPDASRLIEFNIRPKDTLKPGDYSANVTVKTTDGTFLATKEIKFQLS